MIIGHKKQQQFLKKIIASGKIPHALLFTGPEGIGKKTIAQKVISDIFGGNILRHPDFILIEPEGKQIKISQIRDLNWRLSLKPIKAPFVSVLIQNAHLMTREAQNCFLKTLEEPKAETVLILITQHPNFLLPTIVSRCEIIKFYPPKEKEIRDYLQERGAKKEEIEKILKLSLGRPGLAVKLFENPQQLKEREEILKEFIKMPKSSLALRFNYAQKLSKKENLREVLDIWLSYFRNILISQKNKVEERKIIKFVNLLQETIFLIMTTNVNSRLALEVLLMEL